MVLLLIVSSIVMEIGSDTSSLSILQVEIDNDFKNIVIIQKLLQASNNF